MTKWMSQLTNITWGGGIFIAGGNRGEIALSTDCVNWTLNYNNITGLNQVRALTWGAGTFIAVGNEGKIAWSDNGKDWTLVKYNLYDNMTVLYYNLRKKVWKWKTIAVLIGM